MPDISFWAIVIMYSGATFLHGHQGSHLAYLKIGSATLNPILILPMWIYNITFPFVLFSAWIAYKVSWKYSLLIIGMSFILRLVWTGIASATGANRNAWALSLLGIPVIPVLFIFMVRLTLSATDTNSLFDTCRKCVL
jgi:hypothetical protein